MYGCRFAALRLVRNEQIAEDLISEVFLDVWRQAGKFEGRSAVSTWLLAIARFSGVSRCASGKTWNWTTKLRLRSRMRPTTPRSLFRRRTRARR